MVIRLLGTGAADGIPGFFSNDPVSRYAREQGGKDVRSRTAAIVDNVLKLDLPPDSYMQAQKYRLDPTEWTALFFTHSDDDHFSVAEIQYALFPFSQDQCLPFTVYANSTVCAKIFEHYRDWPLDVVETESFRPLSHGPYEIIPIRAHHIEGEDCHNLILSKDNKTILYGTDTGYWSDETFNFLKGVKLDAMVIECTDGIHRSDYDGHLNVESCIAVVKRLREQESLFEGSQIATTHHAWRGGLRHFELEQALGEHGIRAGFDGMTIEV